MINIKKCDECGKKVNLLKRYKACHWKNKKGILTYRCNKCSEKYEFIVKKRKEKQRYSEKKKKEELRKLISDSIICLFDNVLEKEYATKIINSLTIAWGDNGFETSIFCEQKPIGYKQKVLTTLENLDLIISLEQGSYKPNIDSEEIKINPNGFVSEYEDIGILTEEGMYLRLFASLIKENTTLFKENKVKFYKNLLKNINQKIIKLKRPEEFPFLYGTPFWSVLFGLLTLFYIFWLS